MTALGPDYQRITDLLADRRRSGSRGAMGCQEITAALGLDVVPAKVEGVRSKAKRLVERGWLTEGVPGPGPAEFGRRRGRWRTRGGDHHRQQQAEAVHHDVPRAPRHLLPAVVAGRCPRHRRGGPHGLRVDDPRGLVRIPPGRLADPAPLPVVQFPVQALVTPAPVEGVDPVPCGEADGHRPPGDAAGDQVAHGVGHLPVAVGLRLPAPALQPPRHRQRRTDNRPLLVRHVRGVPTPPLGTVGRVTVHMGEAITRGQASWTPPAPARKTATPGPPGTSNGFDNLRATKRPYPHAPTSRRSPERGSRSIGTSHDRYDKKGLPSSQGLNCPPAGCN